jgi:ADP-heptose:LPS heptosyltransferase
MRILVKRMGAFGDVLCTTPVIHRLRKEHPDAEIHVQTHHPYCFHLNPMVDILNANGAGVFDRVIDLDMAYEKRLRKIHSINAYFLEAFGDTEGDKSTYIKRLYPPGDWSKTIVIHPGRSWPQRTPSALWWTCVIDHLMKAGRRVVIIGTMNDLDLRIPGITDTRGQLNCNQQAGLIQAASYFIGNDVGVWGGIVPSTDTPAIGLATMTAPDIMNLYRHGGFGWRTKVFSANVPCVGCSAEMPDPMTSFSCRYGTNACKEAFDPKEIAEAALSDDDAAYH